MVWPMKRIQVNKSEDLQKQFNNSGFDYHSGYWNFNAFYQFDIKEVDYIEDSTNELQAMTNELVAEIINKGDYPLYNFTTLQKTLIEKSFKNKHFSVFGRMDLGYAQGKVKLFEYNADTPTTLPESANYQWIAAEAHGFNDQFNSIYDKLIALWKKAPPFKKIYFTTNADASTEDWQNIHYMLLTAYEAGRNTSSIDIESIGFDSATNKFVDVNLEGIDAVFKLYPWEYMIQDEFAQKIMLTSTEFIEPPWKMLISNKIFLVHLWSKFKNHPLLLETHLLDGNIVNDTKKWMAKPILGREGINVYEYKKNTSPDIKVYDESYSNQSNIIQEAFNVDLFDGMTPVIGSWIVGDESCGMGIREDRGITTNRSLFTPHILID